MANTSKMGRSQLVRVVAASAGVADETLRRLLAGLPVRPVSKERIEAAAESMGVSLEGLRTPPPAGPMRRVSVKG